MNVDRLKLQLSEMDEVELRAFYLSCGLTGETIERAIRVRKGLPTEEKKTEGVPVKSKRSTREP